MPPYRPFKAKYDAKERGFAQPMKFDRRLLWLLPAAGLAAFAWSVLRAIQRRA